jgi:small subunit ribosomal protein S17
MIQEIESKQSQRTIIGEVISNKMDKTIVVKITRKVQDPLYGKFVKRFTKMYAHDQDNMCQIGDKVKIKQCRPLSKTKRWLLVEVLKKEEL